MGNFFSARAAFVWGMGVLVPLLLAGCAPAPPASKVESGARKVVVFDGGAVTEGEVREAVERLNTVQSAAGGAPKREIEPGSPQFEAAKRQVVPQLLAFGLAEAYARENGIEVSEEEIQEEIDRIRDEVTRQAAGAAGQEGSPEEIFRDRLEQFGFTEASLREEVRTSLLVQKVQEEAVGSVEPTEEEVSDFYEENKATQFTIPERRCIRHILFTEDEEDEAQDVRDRLEKGGDFEELAQEYSQDPGSRERGGDLGCQPEGGFVPEFDDAAFGAQEGEIVGPIETDFGFHVIEVTEVQEEEETPLEEVAPEIEERLGRQRQLTEFDQWIRDQLEERNVRYLPGYDPDEPVLPGAPPGASKGEVPEEGVPAEAVPKGKGEPK